MNFLEDLRDSLISQSFFVGVFIFEKTFVLTDIQTSKIC